MMMDDLSPISMRARSPPPAEDRLWRGYGGGTLHMLPRSRGAALPAPKTLLSLVLLTFLLLGRSSAVGAPPATFRVGALFPFYKSAASSPPFARDKSGYHRFASFRLAIEEINNKSDGIADDLLPATKLLFSSADSKRDDATAMSAAFKLATPGCDAAFGGLGVEAIVGPASSGPSISAQYLLRKLSVPQIGYSATSPSLSDSILFPYFVRLPPSDTLQASVLARLISHFGWTRVSTISGSDQYSTSGVQAFQEAARSRDINVVGSQTFTTDSKDVSKEVGLIVTANVRIVGVFCSASDMGTVVHAFGQHPGWGPGQGVAFFFSETIYARTSDFTDSYNAAAMALAGARAAPSVSEALRGGFVVTAFNGRGSPAYDALLRRLRARYPERWATCPAEGSPEESTDDDGNSLDWMDHDGNASTPKKCTREAVGISDEFTYVPYVYDAVYTLARGLHAVLQLPSSAAGTGNAADTVSGAVLLKSIQEVAFEGVTGPVSFDANGDRDGAMKYMVWNHNGAAVDAFQLIGMDSADSEFVPCRQMTASVKVPCAENITFSTADSSKPVEEREEKHEKDNTIHITWVIGVVVPLVLLLAIAVAAAFVVRTRLRRRIRRMQKIIQQLSPEQVEMISEEMGQGAGVIELWRVPFDSIEVGKNIGRGARGTVFRASWRGTPCALKRIDANLVTAEQVQRFRDEIELMVTLRHPNVVQLIGACWEKACIGLIVEFMERGSMSHVLQSEQPEALTWHRPLMEMLCDICRGMSYLHQCEPPIIHRDLKADNCLVNRSFLVKVGDFGESRHVDTAPDRSTMTMVGTHYYAAPEMLRGDRYDKSVDVYSFAVLMGEVLVRPKPVSSFFGDMDRMKVVLRIAQGWRPNLPQTDLSGNPLIEDLIRRCWQDDPAARPSFVEVLGELAAACRVTSFNFPSSRALARTLTSPGDQTATTEGGEDEEGKGGSGKGGGALLMPRPGGGVRGARGGGAAMELEMVKSRPAMFHRAIGSAAPRAPAVGVSASDVIANLLRGPPSMPPAASTASPATIDSTKVAATIATATDTATISDTSTSTADRSLWFRTAAGPPEMSVV